jgi:hypothetical protein
MVSFRSILIALVIGILPNAAIGDTALHLTNISSANAEICNALRDSMQHGITQSMLGDMPQWSTKSAPGETTYRVMRVDVDNDGILDTLVSPESSLANRETYSVLWILRSFAGSDEEAIQASKPANGSVIHLVLQAFPINARKSDFLPSTEFEWTSGGFRLPNGATFRLFSNVDVGVRSIHGHNYLIVFHLLTEDLNYQQVALLELRRDGKFAVQCLASFERS